LGPHSVPKPKGQAGVQQHFGLQGRGQLVLMLYILGQPVHVGQCYQQLVHIRWGRGALIPKGVHRCR
jgi:hypothetical protein